jgi:hypothetical protein
MDDLGSRGKQNGVYTVEPRAVSISTKARSLKKLPIEKN